MPTHFPTVPIDAGPMQALLPMEPLQPVVLVVDDEPIITETLAAILNGAGFTALTAFDGPQALEMALLIPPNVLITDLAMPGFDGIELALRVTHAVSDCEVVLFSGHASISELADRMRSQDCDFGTLIKPVHPADMIDCICERLARRGNSFVPLPGRRTRGSGAPASLAQKEASLNHGIRPQIRPAVVPA